MSRAMRIFGITRAGMAAVALAVLALWSCIGLEAEARGRAARDARVSEMMLQRLRQQAAPASAPLPSYRLGGVKSS